LWTFDLKGRKNGKIEQKGGYMNFSQDILFVLLISVIANATNTDLATNTNFLLLLLLALSNNGGTSSCGCGCNSCGLTF
jgi:hypothetical protein